MKVSLLTIMLLLLQLASTMSVATPNGGGSTAVEGREHGDQDCCWGVFGGHQSAAF